MLSMILIADNSFYENRFTQSLVLFWWRIVSKWDSAPGQRARLWCICVNGSWHYWWLI